MSTITITTSGDASTLVGNPTGSTAALSDISLGGGLSFSGSTLVSAVGDMLAALVNTPVSISSATTLTSTDYAKLHVCSGTSANYNVTLPPPVANSFIGFRMDPALTKLVTITAPVTIAGDTGSRISNLVLNGITTYNSATVGGLSTLYWQIVGTTVSVYRDSGGAHLVAQGTVSGGAVTLSMQNNSGVSGSASIAAGSDETNLASQTFTFGAMIDGQPQRIMWAGEAATLLTDGSNWFKIAGKTIPMVCCLKISISATVPNGLSLTKMSLNTTVIDNTGLMGDITTNHRINAVRPSYYQSEATVGWSNLTADTTRLFGSIYKNDYSIGSGETYGAAGGYPFVYTTVNDETWEVGDYVEIYVAQDSTGNQTVVTAMVSLTEIPQW